MGEEEDADLDGVRTLPTRDTCIEALNIRVRGSTGETDVIGRGLAAELQWVVHDFEDVAS
jgi:hypothetical protein